MKLFDELKKSPKVVMATVAISAATLGFAGGMGVAKQSLNKNQGQSTLAVQQNEGEQFRLSSMPGKGQGMRPNKGQGMPPGEGAEQGMPPAQGSQQGMPAGQGTQQGMPPRQGNQGATPPNSTGSGATSQSANSTSSDEVNRLKEQNQKIKSQLSDSSGTNNQ